MVKYPSTYQGLKPMLAGVPQGSVLGPILYLLYIADLPTTSGTTITNFADDTAVLASITTPIIGSKGQQLGYKLSNLYSLIGRQSILSAENKLLVYKAVLKLAWTYGIYLWGLSQTLTYKFWV